MAPNRVRPSPSKSKSTRRRGVAAEFQDSDTDEFPARYLVRVCSAKNLKREGFRGLTNPYCQLSVGRQGPYTTDVVFDSVNPSWENKRQTFEFREGSGPQEDKLNLACFNSGDVPELIGRLSVALSHATHKIISLPMFRKDLGGSQVWVGSVEIELHYIPEGECASPVGAGRGSRLLEDTDVSGGGGGDHYPPLSPCSTSLGSSFIKASSSFPQKPGASGGRGEGDGGDGGGASGRDCAAVTKAELLPVSPRIGRGADSLAAKASSLPFTEDVRASGIAKSGGHGSTAAAAAAVVVQEDLLALSPRIAKGAESAASAAEGWNYDKRCSGGGSWKSFFSGVLCSALLVLGTLWALGDPLLSGHFGFGLTVLDDSGAGQQALVLIHGSKVSWLADRHVVVFVADQEVCRGGVPAPAPETEGSKWAYDLWSSEAAAAFSDAGGGGYGKGRSGHGDGGEHDGGGGETDCGRWCSFARRVAAPLYAARRGDAGGGPANAL